MYYLQDSDYETAKANGISRSAVYNRVYYRGWSIDEAITKPSIKRDKERAKYARIAQENGISRDLYYRRVKKGIDYKTAATKPPRSKEEVYRIISEANRRLFTTSQVETARANGISYGTLVSRIRGLGWSVQRAITEPVHSKFRRKCNAR